MAPGAIDASAAFDGRALTDRPQPSAARAGSRILRYAHVHRFGGHQSQDHSKNSPARQQYLTCPNGYGNEGGAATKEHLHEAALRRESTELAQGNNTVEVGDLSTLEWIREASLVGDSSDLAGGTSPQLPDELRTQRNITTDTLTLLIVSPLMSASQRANTLHIRANLHTCAGSTKQLAAITVPDTPKSAIKLMIHKSIIIALAHALFLPSAFAVNPSPTSQNTDNQTHLRSCTPYKGLKLTLTIPFKPGGGYDLMGRAFKPFLAQYSGMNVAITNIPGANGALALKTIAEAKSSRPTIGLINLSTFTTQFSEDNPTIDISYFHGLGIMSTEQLVWVSKKNIDWFKPQKAELLGAATSSPYARLGIPAQLLGVRVKPIFGYEGSTDGWMALLRGDVDILPLPDATALRNMETGKEVSASLTLTDQAHPEFPGTPYLAGQGGLLDIKSKGLPLTQRQQVMSMGELSVILAESTRALVVSKNLDKSLLNCLENATQAALLDPKLIETANRQKFKINPISAKSTTEKMQYIDETLRKNKVFLRNIASTMK